VLGDRRSDASGNVWQSVLLASEKG
jgi:hypothetical protein